MPDENGKKLKQAGQPSWLERRSLPLTVVLGAGLTAVIGLIFFWLFAHGLGIDEWYQFWDPDLTGDDLYDVMRSTVAATAVLAGAIAAVVALRRQLVNERKLELDQRATDLADQQDLRARYTKAVELMGHESAAIRLGGVHSLVALATEWQDVNQRQMCVDVLCSYLRISPTVRESTPAEPYAGELAVRDTIERKICEHLQNDTPNHWGDIDINLQGAYLRMPIHWEGLEFKGRAMFDACYFSSEVVFDRTIFHQEATFRFSTFKNVALFRATEFRAGADFERCDFATRIDISGSTFASGVNFDQCVFEGPLSAREVTVTKFANFEQCEFKAGCFIVDCNFKNCSLHFGSVNMQHRARIEGNVFDATGWNPKTDFPPQSGPNSPEPFDFTSAQFAYAPALNGSKFIGNVNDWDAKVGGDDWKVPAELIFPIATPG